MADAARSLLTELRHVLLAHHKALLDSERARYDHDVERIKRSEERRVGKECRSRWSISFLITFFSFSSRRRHTRCLSDWSSDGALPICPAGTSQGAARFRARALRPRRRADQVQRTTVEPCPARPVLRVPPSEDRK